MSFKTETLLEHLIVNYRWIFVCFFLLPASFFFNLWMYVRNYVIFKLNSAPAQHENKVWYVQKQINDWNKIPNSGQGKSKLCTARPGWQTMSFRESVYKDTFNKIHVNLVDILEVDTEKRTVRVEPLVNMGQLTATLNPLGWTIPVLPELDDLTVGGLVMGTGIECSSHIYGLFQQICVSFEIVLADGSLVKCTKTENSELFYSIPWSYGTLGILTAIEIMIIPAKKYIELTYIPMRNIDEMCEKFQEIVKDPNNEFIEVLMYNPDESVMMIGKQTDELKGDLNEIGKWYKPWFFKHVEACLTHGQVKVEYIPLRDYYHRHTRSIFWELQDIIPFGNNIIFRFLLGWLVPPKVSLLKLTQSETTKKLYENNHVIQDMLLPLKYLKKSVLFFNEQTGIFPLWLCPFKLCNEPGFLHKNDGNKSVMYVDIGVYGVPKVVNFKPRECVRKIEKFVMEHDGFQMLYADTYTTRDEFRKMFDHSLYDKLRGELENCKAAFPEVYDKVSKEARR